MLISMTILPIVLHYEPTGPEIWEQTDGKIPFRSRCKGPGTISGVAKYLKKNPKIKIWGSTLMVQFSRNIMRQEFLTK